MNTLRKRRLISDFTRRSIANRYGSVIIDTHVHTDSIITRELDNRVISRHGENENRAAILNLNEWQSNFALGEALIIEGKNQAIPLTLDN